LNCSAAIAYQVQQTSLEPEMKSKITWINGRAFMAESGSGHAIVVDGAPEAGGRNLGPRPMELMLMGLGSCTAFDVVMILEKSREKVVACEVTLESERATEDPKVFTKVKMIYTLKGHDLKPATVERAIKLSADKYCSASKMFEKTAEIEHEWRIENA
jgi:putative redox protein